MKTAKFIKKINHFTGDARLYQVDPSIDGNEFIICSATVVPFSGAETYIFPANSDGEVTDWCELDGSFRGGLSHSEAFDNIGYNII